MDGWINGMDMSFLVDGMDGWEFMADGHRN